MTRRGGPFAAAVIFAAILVGCEPNPSVNVDASYTPPILSMFSVSPPIVDTDTIFISPLRDPEDVLVVTLGAFAAATSGNQTPLRIEVSATGPFGGELAATASLRDDGVFPDTSAGDDTFSGFITLTFKRSLIGACLIEAQVTDGSGLRSASHIVPFILARSNLPPVITDVIADTVVVLSPTSTITFVVRAVVTDPNGLEDIHRTWFDSYLPSGAASSSNPILLFDDGNSSGLSGDVTAGDGTFARIIQLPPNTTTGQYRFEFKSVDRSLDTSATVVHVITVQQ